MGEHNIRNFTINFGPQHPAAHGVLRLVLELDGEVVERVDPHIGLLHRGTEKLIEYKTYTAGDALFRPARLRRADEPGARLLPGGREAARHRRAAPGAAHPRALFRDRPAALAPAQRDDAGDGRRRAHAAALGLRGAREADDLLRARLRLAACTPTISGPAACTRTCRRSSSTISRRSATRSSRWSTTSTTLVIGNRIFKQRNVDIGVVTLDECWKWGFSGVMVRGSGAAWDLRKAQPYECYEEMEFDIPVGQERRQLRPPGHPHGGDAPVRAHHAAMHREAARAGRAGAGRHARRQDRAAVSAAT